MNLNLKECFKLMVQHHISDLHLKVGTPPLVRKNGQLMRLYKEQFSLTNTDIVNAIEPFLNTIQKNKLKEEKQLDLSYGFEGVGRFRFNIFYQRGTLRLVARNIPFKLPSYKSLNLPNTIKNVIQNPEEQKGLILVAGATRSGKSSTIVAMLNHINQKFNQHIITIEDPIEFLIKDKKSLITQRELGTDYINYNMALKSALRQDPDIIFFGEIRDVSSMETTLTASNTGHLVLSTIHTNNVIDTIHRVLGMVKPSQKGLFRMEFASSLRAIICQKLIMKKDQSGLIPVVEILINNPRVRAFLEDEKQSTSNLYEIIEESKEVWGMQSFNQHLIELFEKNIITKEQALLVSPSSEKLTLHFNGLSQRNTESQIELNNKNNGLDKKEVSKNSIPLDIVKDGS